MIIIVLSILTGSRHAFTIQDLIHRELRKIGGLLKQLNTPKELTDPGISNELIIPNLQLPKQIIGTPFRKLDHKHLYLDMNTELLYDPSESTIMEDYTKLLGKLPIINNKLSAYNQDLLFAHNVD